MEDLGIEAKLVSSGEVLSKFNLDGPLEQLEFVLRSESYEVASNTPLVLGSEPQLETNESTQTKRWMNVELGVVDAEKFKSFLRGNGYKFEPSEAGKLVSFSTY